MLYDLLPQKDIVLNFESPLEYKIGIRFLKEFGIL